MFRSNATSKVAKMSVSDTDTPPLELSLEPPLDPSPLDWLPDPPLELFESPPNLSPALLALIPMVTSTFAVSGIANEPPSGRTGLN